MVRATYAWVACGRQDVTDLVEEVRRLRDALIEISGIISAEWGDSFPEEQTTAVNRLFKVIERELPVEGNNV